MASAATAARPSGLVIENLSKTFPGVIALDEFGVDVAAGSVHALVGPNGCGKSTFVKVLAGIHRPDPGGRILVDGAEIEVGSAADADAAGVRFVHQDLGIVEALDAVDNVALGLGYQRSRVGTISWRAQRRQTRELLDRFGVAVALDSPLSEASPVERTAVAIVRALAGGIPGRGLLILDEPTAALPHREVEQLYGLVRDVKATGVSVVLISHRLDEVVAIADTVSVMRAGKVIGGGPVAEMDVARMAAMIAGGKHLVADAPLRTEAAPPSQAPVVLRATGIRGRHLRGVDLELHEGEVVGVAGLLGSGRDELPYAVGGAGSIEVEGQWELGGEQFTEMTLDRAARSGVFLIPAERARQSIVAPFTVSENLSIPSLSKLKRGGLLSPAGERRFARDWMTALDVRASAANMPITVLSGGNQQKVVLARWLAMNPKLLVMSEPTAGVDVGARSALYEIVRARAADGLSVLVASSDAQDLVHMCDRVLVMRNGTVAAEITGARITESEMVDMMEGVVV
ncbi:MAG TPA: sugar ABC transporter ATP-binding protein [Baekduia sp.]|jgi:ribose transport system ATP-binding protein